VKKEILDFSQISNEVLKGILVSNDHKMEYKLNKEKEEKLKRKRETLNEPNANEVKFSQHAEKEASLTKLPVTEIKKKKKKKEGLNQSNEVPKMKKRPNSKKSKSKLKEQNPQLQLPFQMNVCKDDSTLNK
jgi:hypothetical protein